MFLLLVADIIEEAEVVVEEEQGKLSSQEREEKPEEQGQEYPRTGALSDQPPLEALAVRQVELSPTNETDPKAYLRLQRKDHQRRKHPLSQTSCIIQGNPGLWANAKSLVPLLRGQMLRRTRRNRSRRRGGGEGTHQLRGGQGNWGARELWFGGAVITTGTVPAEPWNLSTCMCLSK